MSSKHPRENKQFYGHLPQIELLANLVESNKVPHAFLFSGKKGIGKATLAYHLAKLLLTKYSDNNFVEPKRFEPKIEAPALAEEPDSFDMFAAFEPAPVKKTAEPEAPKVVSHGDYALLENNSRHAEKVTKAVHPDLMIIDSDTIEKSEIKIDDVRKLHGFLSLTPSESNARVIIIDSADYMNTNAANAILKILEEPNKNCYLILISHKPAFILPTIKSRCREIKFKDLSEEDFDNIITENLSKRIMENDSEEIDFAKKVSNNSAGLTIFLKNHKAFEIYNNIGNLFDNSAFSITDIKKFSDMLKTKEAWLTFEEVFSYYYHVKAMEISKSDNDNKIEALSSNNNIIENLFEKHNDVLKVIRDVTTLNFDKSDSLKKIYSILNK